MPEIAQNFRLRRVALRPLPLGLELRIETIGVVDALDVAARAGITVPVPGAADIIGTLEQLCRQAETAQTMQQVQPGKAGAHDDGVELPVVPGCHPTHFSPPASL